MVGYIHDVPGPPLLDLEENMSSEGWEFKDRWQIFEKLSKRDGIGRSKLIPCARRTRRT